MSVSKASHDCSAPHVLWSILPPCRGALSPVAVPFARGTGRCDPPQVAATVWATGQPDTPPTASPLTSSNRLVSAWENRRVPNPSCPQSTSHKAHKPTALDSISEHVTSFQKDFSSCSSLASDHGRSARRSLPSRTRPLMRVRLAPPPAAPLIVLAQTYSAPWGHPVCG